MLAEKVAAVIRQLDKDGSKNVNGVSASRMLLKKQNEHWIKNRTQAGLSKVSAMRQDDLAKEIFKSWDTNLHRYLTIDEIAENFIGLGLAPNTQFVKEIV